MPSELAREFLDAVDWHGGNALEKACRELATVTAERDALRKGHRMKDQEDAEYEHDWEAENAKLQDVEREANYLWDYAKQCHPNLATVSLNSPLFGALRALPKNQPAHVSDDYAAGCDGSQVGHPAQDQPCSNCGSRKDDHECAPFDPDGNQPAEGGRDG